MMYLSEVFLEPRTNQVFISWILLEAGGISLYRIQ
jgi:hypothetical protein